MSDSGQDAPDRPADTPRQPRPDESDGPPDLPAAPDGRQNPRPDPVVLTPGHPAADRPNPVRPIPGRPDLPRPGPRQRFLPPGDVVAINRKDLLAEAQLDELLDPKTLKLVLGRLAPLIETDPIDPGAVSTPRLVTPDAFSAIVRSAAAVAAGIDRADVGKESVAVTWSDDVAELIVHVDDVTTELGDGLVDVVVPVECDETGRVEIVVTIVTAHPDRPFGSVFATNHRPHGPRIIVDRWAEALIAFAWQTVAESASLIASTAGRDRDNRDLGASSIVASTKGLTVVPIGEHRFSKFRPRGGSG